MAGHQINALARRIADLETARLKAKQPNLGFSTIDGGAIQAVDQDEALTMIIGQQFDGTNTSAVVTGPTPPTPILPLVTPGVGILRIYWDGTFADDAVAPMDFTRVLAYAQPTSEYVGPDPLNQAIIVGQISSATGGEITAALEADVEYVVYLVAWTEAGKHSEASEVDFGTPQGLPDVSGPTDPPDASPELTAIGMTTSIMLRAQPVDATTSIIYQISTDYDPETGVGTWAALPDTPTRDQNYSTDTLADGITPLVQDTVYWFRALATNAIDDASMASSPVPASLDLDAVTVKADDVLTNRLDSVISVTGRMEVGSGWWDADDGLYLPGADNSITQFSVDGVTPHRIDGHFIGRSATFEDNTNLKGETVIQGTARAADGINAPTAEPGVSKSWASLTNDLSDSLFEDFGKGICQNITEGDQWVVVSSFFGAEIRSINKTTGALNPFILPSFSNFYPDGGIVNIGTSYYVLGKDSTRSNRWFVYRLNSSFAKVGEWEYTHESSSTFNPVIGTDGTNVVIARCAGPGSVNVGKPQIRTYVATTGVATAAGTTGAGLVTCDTALNTDLGGVYVGTADFGAARILVATSTGATVVNAFVATTGASANTHDFPRAGGSVIRGLMRDSTGFHTLGAKNVVWHYEEIPTSQTVDAVYTWFDGTGTTHETTPSPPATMAWSARSRLIISMPPAIEYGVAGTDVANGHRVYVGPTGGTLRLQATPAVGTDTVTLTSLNTGSATPPATNGFELVGSAPGELVSTAMDETGANPVWRLSGDGTIGRDSGIITPTGSFSGAGVRFRRFGQLVFVSGYVQRLSGFSTSFASTGIVIPLGFRPPADLVLPTTLIWSTNTDLSQSFGYQLTAAGSLEIRMNGATTNQLPINAVYYTD